MQVPYKYGLHKLSEHCHVWLQPDGSWGLSNAGLIVGSDSCVLIDTLVDLKHTQLMLDAISHITDLKPITRVITTHADADHFFGHQLLDATVEIFASKNAAANMNEEHLQQVLTMLESDGPGGDYAREAFAPFDFSNIKTRSADTAISEPTKIWIDNLCVELIPVIDAHSTGDMIVWIEEEKVLFAGDLLFIDAAPITWAGPPSSWAKVCDQIIELAPQLIVPGHGPVTDVTGVAYMRDYLLQVEEQATQKYHEGLSVLEAARSIDLGVYKTLAAPGRLVQNVQNVYRHLDPATPPIRVMQEHAQFEKEFFERISQ